MAGADWLLADQLGCDPLENTAWEMVQKNLRCWLSDPEGLARGENTALEALFTGLAYTGFSMQYYLKSSRPASGAEHLISHTWEMRGLNNQGRDISHGFKVALGTLIVTALYEQTFALSRAELAAIMEQQAPLSPSERQKEVDGALGGTPFYQNAREIALAKLLPLDEWRERYLSIL